ncbi:hypothetical protein [Nocardiopsis aegyptia]|uniref:Uncharacterized protein n=1 Tax=Nocardiopsis aegyptia TaxID=220378 RepID=A0A7Z0ERB6_9ACTN|nr:hypothetical protein [Nocardiopsis aegyptia]NYJ35920.1 hypothetical protein [Nocardiopsis aegyptia]
MHTRQAFGPDDDGEDRQMQKVGANLQDFAQAAREIRARLLELRDTARQIYVETEEYHPEKCAHTYQIVEPGPVEKAFDFDRICELFAEQVRLHQELSEQAELQAENARISQKKSLRATIAGTVAGVLGAAVALASFTPTLVNLLASLFG